MAPPPDTAFTAGCEFCRPQHNAKKEVIGYSHQMVSISVVGTGLSLPFDAEPYGPGDSEYAAGQRLLARARSQLGARFADYLVVDGGYATAPFLHASDRAGIPIIARLKDNLPELSQSVERRFAAASPTRVYRDGKDRVEIWDADDFAPWETLRWDRVRVIRYRQHKPDQTTVQAQWLTNLPSRRVGSLSLYHLAKSRWEIENQGFNDAKNHYGLEHICHHHPNSIDRLAACPVGPGHRTALPNPLSASRAPPGVLSADQLCRVSLAEPIRTIS